MALDTSTPEHARLVRLLGYLTADPRNLSLLRDAMDLVLSQGDVTSGAVLLDHLQAQAISDPELQAQACHVCLMRGDYAKAAEYGNLAISAGISHPAVIHNTALAYFYNLDFAGATPLLAKLTSTKDCPAVILVAHARALYEQELTEEAEPLALEATRAEPDNLEAQGLLALLKYENGDNQGALLASRDVLAKNPDQLDALVACASAHFELGNIEPARKAWLHTTAQYPTYGRAWSGLGQLEFNDLDFVPAEAHLKLAVQFMPDHIGTWHLLAWIYILREDSVLARQALDASYALDRRFADTHGGLAVVDALEGHEDQARIGIRRALKLNPQCMSAHYAELLLLQKAGREDQAKALVEDVLSRTLPDGNSGHVLVQQWMNARQGRKITGLPGQH